MLSDEQLAIRRQGIGSSEIAAILGLDPEKTAIDVYLDKMGAAEDNSSEQTEIGNVFEEPIARIAARKLGGDIALARGNTVLRGLAVATPDFYASWPDDREIWETKNVGYRMMSRWDADVDDDTGPPEYVIVQLQWQLEVCGVARGRVPALLGGRDHRVYGPIARDREVGKWMIETAEAWWQRHVEREDPPPVDGTKAGWKLLGHRHPFPSSTAYAEVTPELRAELDALREACAEEARIADEIELRRQRVAALIGDAPAAVWFEGKVRRAVRYGMQNGRVSWKDVAIEMNPPVEVIEKHRGEPKRVLTLPRGWTKERGE